MAQFEGVDVALVLATIDRMAQAVGLAPHQAITVSAAPPPGLTLSALLATAVRYCDTHQTVFSQHRDYLDLFRT